MCVVQCIYTVTQRELMAVAVNCVVKNNTLRTLYAVRYSVSKSSPPVDNTHKAAKIYIVFVKSNAYLPDSRLRYDIIP